MKIPQQISVQDWLANPSQFDDVLDARSPAEFEHDHAPNAVSSPVLNDEERIVVGTMYKQTSSFDAKKLGSALVSKNIGHMIEHKFQDKPRDWRPLVMCWRGGQRSGSLAIVLAQVGWRVAQLEGGYKAFRHAVLDQLNTLPQQFKFRVVCGPTGSGKSRLLSALKTLGAQVLDLEQLANHKGSVLGHSEDRYQPSQKKFETSIWFALRSFDPQQTVYIEAESKKVGNVHVPDVLMDTMRQSPCVLIDMSREQRVQLLLDDYTHWQTNTDWLKDRLEALVVQHGRDVVNGWIQMIDACEWKSLVSSLLDQHYDAAYLRSTNNNFKQFDQAHRLPIEWATDESIKKAAEQLLNSLNAIT